jgi:hypothetical protein
LVTDCVALDTIVVHSLDRTKVREEVELLEAVTFGTGQTKSITQ